MNAAASQPAPAAWRFFPAVVALGLVVALGWGTWRVTDFWIQPDREGERLFAAGRYNEGGALLMHGDYDGAIAAYDRALAIRPDWPEAIENRALAVARRDQLRVDDKIREAEQTEAYDPDAIVVDDRGGKMPKPPEELGAPNLSDAELQASWLRRVQTSPGDFLRAKFAWQAAHPTVVTPPAP